MRRLFLKMSNEKSFFDKTVDFVLDSVSGTKARDIYEEGIAKVNEVGTLAKTMLALNSEKDELKRTYIEIGKLCYENNKDNPDPSYSVLFDKVSQLSQSIEEKQLMVDALKSTIVPKNTSSAGSEKDESVDVIEFGRKDYEE